MSRRHLLVAALVGVVASVHSGEAAANWVGITDPNTGPICDVPNQSYKHYSPMPMKRNGDTMSSYSTATTAYYKAISEWGGVPLTSSMVYDNGVTFGDPVDYTDNINHVTRDSFTYDYGSAHVRGIKLLGNCMIVNVDIKISEWVSFPYPDEAQGESKKQDFEYARGYTTMLHEFGHAMGFNHTTGSTFSIMNVTPPGIQPLLGTEMSLLGGRPTRVNMMPIDVAGMRALYSSGAGTSYDVAATAQGVSGYAIARLYDPDAPAQSLCRGATFTVGKAAANRGNSMVGASQQLYLSASLNHHTHSPAHQVWASSPHPFLPPHSVSAGQVTATVPCGISTGTYHVYHGVDYTQSFAEAVEDNNIVRTGKRIIVQDCGC
jgi:hypothetical protein